MSTATPEFQTYLRSLPALIAGGHEGHYALIRGDQLLGTWSSLADALRAGYDRFGIDTPFATQLIRGRDLSVCAADATLSMAAS